MLTRMLDTSGIDMNDPLIKSELEIDLRRMDRLKHEEMPDGVNAYNVIITPSTRTYSPLLHRFLFEIQYGCIIGNNFEPKGKPLRYQSETLPMI
jgi:hypothetical protein